MKYQTEHSTGMSLVFLSQHIGRARYYAIVRPSVRPSVTRVDQSKRLKLGSCNVHHRERNPSSFCGI